jgi:hypothetical protein
MGVINDRHGTYYAQKRVRDRLQAAVARLLNSGKARQVFLKKSLGTKGSERGQHARQAGADGI